MAKDSSVVVIPELSVFYSESATIPVFVAMNLNDEDRSIGVFLVTASTEEEAKKMLEEAGYDNIINVIRLKTLFDRARMFAEINSKLGLK